MVKYITQKNTGRRPASTLEASPGSLLSLYNFRYVGLTVCLLELLSNKRKDGCGDGMQIQEGRDIFILVDDSHCCMAEQAKHCKVIILQLKVNIKNKEKR